VKPVDTLISFANIRQGWNDLPATNTLAYLSWSSVTKKKGLISLTFGSFLLLLSMKNLQNIKIIFT